MIALIYVLLFDWICFVSSYVRIAYVWVCSDILVLIAAIIIVLLQAARQYMIEIETVRCLQNNKALCLFGSFDWCTLTGCLLAVAILVLRSACSYLP